MGNNPTFMFYFLFTCRQVPEPNWSATCSVCGSEVEEKSGNPEKFAFSSQSVVEVVRTNVLCSPPTSSKWRVLIARVYDVCNNFCHDVCSCTESIYDLLTLSTVLHFDSIKVTSHLDAKYLDEAMGKYSPKMSPL